MGGYSQTQSTIQRTRKVVITLSVIIIITSLGQYSKDAVSVFTLFPSNIDIIAHNINEDTVNINKIHYFGQALIRDQRLIATLVAAQTSLFCPLFLLVGNAVSSIDHHHVSADEQHKYLSPSAISFWKTTLYFLCQIIMILGLIVNWLFCLSFDHKTKHIQIYFPGIVPSSSSYSIWSFALGTGCNVSMNLLDGLKYLTIMALALEMILVCIGWIQHSSSRIDLNDCKKSEPIQLV